MILARVVDEDKELNWENLRFLQGVVKGPDTASRDTHIEESLLRDTSYVLITKIQWK